jgi:hypothetical protein
MKRYYTIIALSAKGGDRHCPLLCLPYPFYSYTE